MVSPAQSLTSIGAADSGENDHKRLQIRRLTFVVFFRVILISLVLGITTLLYWLSDSDLTTASTITVFAVVGITYLLTLAYSLAIREGSYIDKLGTLQLIADLAIASVIVHATGGAQSAYTFFFPVAIIGAALLLGRRGTILISVAALALFLIVSGFGWAGIIPVISGQEVRPDNMTLIELLRALALNGAAIIGVALLSTNLGSQLQQTRSSLLSQTSVAADLRTLHSDIVRSLASGLLTVGTDGVINSINLAAERILHRSNESLVGTSLDALFPGVAHRSNAAQRVHRVEERIRVDSDEVVLGVSISPLFDHSHNPIGKVVNFQDLTELRTMEERVKRGERLAVIGRLAAGVAHEIRNPLASISGSIELLAASRPLPAGENEENATLMEIVTREIDRLNALITELLDYANPGTTTRAELDFSQLVRDTISVFERDRDLAKVAIDSTEVADEIRVNGDGEKLRQVLWNLLRNAA